MSQISVVHYSPPLNNVLQQNNISNKQNERQIIVIRKPQHILPQPKVLEEDDILLTNNAKKKPKSIRETKPNAQSISVARRNARERNRVKQVNNGFANLRQHIPSFIAAAFESNSGRGGNKKLSKVETLRMAVEYIKSLEEILNMNTDNSEIMDHLADFPYPSPSSSTSPSHSSNTNMTYCYQALSPPFDDDELSNSSQSSHQQFIKLSNNQSFQIIPHTVMENGENLDPMVVDENMMQHSSILNQNLEFSVSSQDLTYLNSMHTTGSMSPGLYSDSSLSPIHNIKSDPNAYITVFNTPPEERQSPGLTIKVEDNCDMPVISLKTEQELSHEHKENIANVLEWWEQQPQNVHS